MKQKLSLVAGSTSAASFGAWAGMPYTLFADGAMVKQGVMDEKGAIDVDHHVTTTDYRIELANGVSFGSPVGADYKGSITNAELANQGLHRHESEAHPDITPVVDRKQMRELYSTLSNPKSEV